MVDKKIYEDKLSAFDWEIVFYIKSIIDLFFQAIKWIKENVIEKIYGALYKEKVFLNIEFNK